MSSQKLSDLQEKQIVISGEIGRYREGRRMIRSLDAKIRKLSNIIRRQSLLRASQLAVADLKRERVTTVAQALADTANRFVASSSDRFVVELGKRKFDVKVCRQDEEGKEYLLPIRLLSGGEDDQASAAFLLAVQSVASSAKRTNLLMMDEPCAHVNEDSWLSFLELISVLNDGRKTVFISTHVEAAKQSGAWDRVVKVTKRKGKSSLRILRAS